MKIKTSDLTGPALRWAVLIANDVLAKPVIADNKPGVYWAVVSSFHPDTDWSQGGPIIEREHISTTVDDSGVWLAYCKYNYANEARFMHAGPTPLMAAMRCYVASRLGDEVDVPEELV